MYAEDVMVDHNLSYRSSAKHCVIAELLEGQRMGDASPKEARSWEEQLYFPSLQAILFGPAEGKNRQLVCKYLR